MHQERSRSCISDEKWRLKATFDSNSSHSSWCPRTRTLQQYDKKKVFICYLQKAVEEAGHYWLEAMSLSETKMQWASEHNNVCRLSCTLDRSWSRERALHSFLSICSMFIYSGQYICIYLLYNVCYVMKDLNLIWKKIDQDNC